MYNEMFADDRSVRAPYEKVAEWINAAGVDLLKLRQSEAEAIFRKIGITFAVYGEGGDPERLIPFDLIPRVFGASEWRRLSRGIKQRSRALNAFLYDVYHRGEIMRAGIIPEELVYQNEAFLPDMVGVDPPGGSTATSSASTSCAPMATSSRCSRTIAVRLRASATCSRTARS